MVLRGDGVNLTPDFYSSRIPYLGEPDELLTYLDSDAILSAANLRKLPTNNRWLATEVS